MTQEGVTDLTFETQGLDERQVAAYQQGIVDTLTKLGYDIEYDETAPDLSTYRVRIGEVPHVHDKS